MLRTDGTLWLNLGDSYAGGGRNSGNSWEHTTDKQRSNVGSFTNPTTIPAGLKPKDLCGIPWRVALALQLDGWWLRSAMPWVKRSAMPESCSDRPASALEYMFLLTKSQKYYFDMDVIRKHQAPASESRYNYSFTTTAGKTGLADNLCSISVKQTKQNDGKERFRFNPSGRNFRNTDLFFESLKEPHGMIFCGDEMVGIDCNPQPMKESHFATFAPKLVEPCILAGTSERGCCSACGKPVERVVEKIRNRNSWGVVNNPEALQNSGAGYPLEGRAGDVVSKTIGWQPGCKCNVGTKPCVVLDIFGGAMTTAIVAHKHGRNFVMIELSESYIKDIGIPRIEKQTKQRGLFR